MLINFNYKSTGGEKVKKLTSNDLRNINGGVLQQVMHGMRRNPGTRGVAKIYDMVNSLRK